MPGFLSILKQYALKFVGGPIGGIVADKLGAVSKLQIVVFVLMFGIIMYIANVSGGAELITALTVLTLVLATLCFMSRGTMWATIDEAGVPKEISGYRDSCGFNHRFQHARPHLPTLIGNWLDKYGNAAYGRVFTLLGAMCVIGVAASVTLLVSNRISAKKAA